MPSLRGSTYSSWGRNVVLILHFYSLPSADSMAMCNFNIIPPIEPRSKRNRSFSFFLTKILYALFVIPMRFTCLAHPIPLHLIILIIVDEEQKLLSFQALRAVDDQSMTFFCVYTPCGRCVLWCFGGKPESIFRVAVWIAWMPKWLEKGVCQSYGKARGNLAFFRPFQHPRDSDSHPEGGGSTFLQNFRTHKYHKAYKSERRPTEPPRGLPHYEVFSTSMLFPAYLV